MDTVEKPLVSPVPRDGYLLNPGGKYTNIEAIKPRDLLEYRLTEELIGEALEMQGMLSLFRAKCFDAISTFRADLASQYGARTGGTRGGISIRNLAGTLRITVSEADTLSFGPELEVAKALIDECLESWTAGGNENLRAVVNEAFHVGESKKVRMDRVLGLRRIKIDDDDRWNRAMLAINDAVRTERSKMYLRFYRREAFEGDFDLIVLDLARV